MRCWFYIARSKRLAEDDVLTSKHIGANYIYVKKYSYCAVVGRIKYNVVRVLIHILVTC